MCYMNAQILLGGGGFRRGDVPGRLCRRYDCRCDVADSCWGGALAEIAEVVAVDATSLANAGILFPGRPCWGGHHRCGYPGRCWACHHGGG